MRREFRRKENIKKGIVIGGITAGVLSVIIIIYLTVLTSSINSEIEKQNLAKTDFNIMSDENEDFDSEDTSLKIGKDVEEAENELNEEFETFTDTNITDYKNVSEKKEEKNKINTSKETVKKSKIENKKEINNEKAQNKENKETKFYVPVKGQIVREFAKDSLVYSNTLDEWVTHNGIDIKADKTSVVTASANGKVYAIKNDPRYGLTVIINHDGGYKTVYSNLLTAEFVVEGEKVQAGQTIGTVGNTASFEIGDDYHLHFEIIKNNEYIDPTTCINFK